jgi:hypothetical protein
VTAYLMHKAPGQRPKRPQREGHIARMTLRCHAWSMKQAVVILAGLVAGCATADSMRDQAPFFAAHSAKPTQDVAGCVAVAWGSAGFNLRTEAGSDRTSVILSGSTMVGSDMVADIYTDGRVTMQRRKAIWSGLDGKLRDKLAACL